MAENWYHSPHLSLQTAADVLSDMGAMNYWLKTGNQTSGLVAPEHWCVAEIFLGHVSAWMQLVPTHGHPTHPCSLVWLPGRSENVPYQTTIGWLCGYGNLLELIWSTCPSTSELNGTNVNSIIGKIIFTISLMVCIGGNLRGEYIIFHYVYNQP